MNATATPAADIDTAVDLAGLRLSNPMLTASGTCGYGPEYAPLVDLTGLGGFVTKSVTPEMRFGNAAPRVAETHSGMMNAIGLANVGLTVFQRDKRPALQPMIDAGVAIFVNVAGKSTEDYLAVCEALASDDGVAGIELNVSCPNVKDGTTFGTDAARLEALTRHVRDVLDAGGSAGSRRRLMVKLSPNVTDIAETAKGAIAGGADILSLINTFTALSIDVETRRPRIANGTGGLSGPAVRPIAVYMVHRVYRMVAREAGVPIVGLGGVASWQDAAEFLLAGASAVAVGTTLFTDPSAPLKILDGLKAYAARQGVSRLADLTGQLDWPAPPPMPTPDADGYATLVPAAEEGSGNQASLGHRP